MANRNLRFEAYEERTLLTAAPEFFADLNTRTFIQYAESPEVLTSGEDVVFANSTRLWNFRENDLDEIEVALDEFEVITQIESRVIVRSQEALWSIDTTDGDLRKLLALEHSDFLNLEYAIHVAESHVFAVHPFLDESIVATDGTKEGTVVVYSTGGDLSRSPIIYDSAVDGLYFQEGFRQIWFSDGTQQGTAPVDGRLTILRGSNVGDGRSDIVVRDPFADTHLAANDDMSQDYLAVVQGIATDELPHVQVGDQIFVAREKELHRLDRNSVEVVRVAELDVRNSIGEIAALGQSIIIGAGELLFAYETETGNVRFEEQLRERIHTLETLENGLLVNELLFDQDLKFLRRLQHPYTEDSQVWSHRADLYFDNLVGDIIKLDAETLEDELVFEVERQRLPANYPVGWTVEGKGGFFAFDRNSLVRTKGYYVPYGEKQKPFEAGPSSAWVVAAEEGKVLFASERTVDNRRELGLYEEVQNGVSGTWRVVGHAWHVSMHTPRLVGTVGERVIISDRDALWSANWNGEGLTRIDGVTLAEPFDPSREVRRTGEVITFRGWGPDGKRSYWATDGTVSGTKQIDFPYTQMRGVTAIGRTAMFVSTANDGDQLWAFDEDLGLRKLRTFETPVDPFDRSNDYVAADLGLYFVRSEGQLIAFRPDGSEAYAVDIPQAFRIEEFHGKLLVWSYEENRRYGVHFVENGRVVDSDIVLRGEIVRFRERIFIVRVDYWELTGNLKLGHVWNSESRRHLYAVDDGYIYHFGTDEIHGDGVWRTEIAYTTPGDINVDGNVTFEDFLILSENFGRRTHHSRGDVNGDNLVDFADFLLLADNFMG